MSSVEQTFNIKVFRGEWEGRTVIGELKVEGTHIQIIACISVMCFTYTHSEFCSD